MLAQQLGAETQPAHGIATTDDWTRTALANSEGVRVVPFGILDPSALLHFEQQLVTHANWLRSRLAGGDRRESLPNRLRKRLGLKGVRAALLHEWGRPLPGDLAPLLKALPVRHRGFRPLDEAISTAGGLRFAALTDGLMLRDRAGTFAAGEMLDWEAPTGGYLLTACLATGRLAGQAAAARLARRI